MKISIFFIVLTGLCLLNGCSGGSGGSEKEDVIGLSPCGNNCSGPTVSISWDPSPASDGVTSYAIYAGSTLDNAMQQQLGNTVSIFSPGFDVNAPSVTYSLVDLRVNTGDTLCMRLKAINSAGASDFSTGACESIP